MLEVWSEEDYLGEVMLPKLSTIRKEGESTTTLYVLKIYRSCRALFINILHLNKKNCDVVRLTNITGSRLSLLVKTQKCRSIFPC